MECSSFYSGCYGELIWIMKLDCCVILRLGEASCRLIGCLDSMPVDNWLLVVMLPQPGSCKVQFEELWLENYKRKEKKT